MRHIACAIAVAALAACASNPKDQAAASAGDLATSLEQAQAARQAGDQQRATALLRDAAKAHPTDKQPWLRLAQLQFDNRDYNQAVSAAQEALQRDASDQTALSIVAVSGLRLASQSLQQLRRGHASVQAGVSSRAEAEALAHTIREALGENVLVPAAAVSAAAAASAPVQAPRTRRRAIAAVQPAATPSTAAQAASLPAAAAPVPSIPQPANGAAAAVPAVRPAVDRPATDKPAARGGNPFTILQ